MSGEGSNVVLTLSDVGYTGSHTLLELSLKELQVVCKANHIPSTGKKSLLRGR